MIYFSLSFDMRFQWCGRKDDWCPRHPFEYLLYQQYITAWPYEKTLIYRRNIFPLKAPHKETLVLPLLEMHDKKIRWSEVDCINSRPTWKAQLRYGKSTWNKLNCSCGEGRREGGRDAVFQLNGGEVGVEEEQNTSRRHGDSTNIKNAIAGVLNRWRRQTNLAAAFAGC